MKVNAALKNSRSTMFQSPEVIEHCMPRHFALSGEGLGGGRATLVISCERDYGFGQVMLALRATIGLTQVALADYLAVSRRAVGEWESGGSYPKAEHLKVFIALAFAEEAFPAGHGVDAIRDLWRSSR